jgi:hypothetical protein
MAHIGRRIGMPCLALRKNSAEALLKRVAKLLKTFVAPQKKRQEGGSLMLLAG